MSVVYNDWPLANWRRPARSMNNGNCVEVASGAGVVAIRDSKDLDGLILRCPAVSWKSFLAGMDVDGFGPVRL
jgi:hypothetical protein